MYYDFLQSNKKRIIRGVSVFLGVLLLWTVTSLAGRIGKIPVTMAIVPSNASVTLDGSESGTSGTKWVTPGTYTVSVARDGFASQTQKIVVTGEKEENVIAISLVPQSDQAKRWATDNAEEYKDNERYGAKQARATGEFIATKNPIVTKLPYTDPYYKIAYEMNGDEAVVTIVTESPRYRFYAVEKIREWGYEPTDLSITFKNFKNPLEQP